MSRDNSHETGADGEADNGLNRRSFVGAVGASSVALGGMGTAAAQDRTTTEDVAETERVTGQRAADYASRALKTVRQSDAYDGLRSHLDVRGYGLTDRNALVTENTESGAVSVFVPLTGDSIDNDLQPTSGESTGEELAHFVWTDRRPDAGHVVRTGSADRVVPESTDADRRLETSGTRATEFITNSKHVVQYFGEASAPRGADTVSDGTGEYAVCTIDVRQGSVELQRESDFDVGTLDNCPGGIAPTLGYLSVCGAACAACTSLAAGNWMAVFACIGCAACGCGLACCLGDMSNEVCIAADTVIAGGTLVFGAGQVAAAYCAKDGCTGGSCAPNI